VGAWTVAPLASEWIHQAVLAIRAEIPIDVLKDTIAQFPSFSEAFGAALPGPAERSRRDDGSPRAPAHDGRAGGGALSRVR
jgi:pyridine nucleotide-disulfide oxidoreductase